MKPNERLQKEAEFIRKKFFPQWDKERKWVFEIDAAVPGRGFCFIETRQIKLSFISDDDDELHLLLIHEICHAVGFGGYHAKGWQKRMQKAGDKARAWGRERLANTIYKEARDYADPEKTETITAATVYSEIRDCVLAYPGAPYEKVIEVAARRCGCPGQLDERYHGCKRAYENAVKLFSRRN